MKKTLQFLLVISLFFTSLTYADYKYYAPVFKCPPDHWSGFGITNLSGRNTANVDINVYRTDGTLLITQRKTIKPKGQTNFLVGSTLTADGWIKISSDQPLAGLNFLGEYKGGNDYYLADVPFTKILSESLIIPHVAQNSIWDTTILIANPNSEVNQYSITYVNQNGNNGDNPWIGELQANSSTSFPMSNISRRIGEIRGGSIAISSDLPMAVFALYNNVKSGNSSYAGINSVDTTIEKLITGTWAAFSRSGDLEAAPPVGTKVVLYSDGTYQILGDEVAIRSATYSYADGKIFGQHTDVDSGMISFWFGYLRNNNTIYLTHTTNLGHYGSGAWKIQ